MKMDNKGTSILEILVSVCIISIVMIFLANLLIKVKSQDTDAQVRADYLINQALFIKTINEDILDIGIKEAQVGCVESYINSISDLGDKTSIGYENNCVQLSFANGEYGFLFFYQDIVDYSLNSKKDIKNLVRYSRGSFSNLGGEADSAVDWHYSLSLTKEFPTGTKLDEIILRKNDYFHLYNINFPIKDTDDNIYNIDITYSK